MPEVLDRRLQAVRRVEVREVSEELLQAVVRHPGLKVMKILNTSLSVDPELLAQAVTQLEEVELVDNRLTPGPWPPAGGGSLCCPRHIQSAEDTEDRWQQPLLPVSHRTPGPPDLPPHRSALGLWRPGRRSPGCPATLLPCPPPLHRPAATDVTATHQPSFPTSRPTFSLQPSSRPPTLVSQIIGIQDWNCTIFGIQDWVPPTNQPASSQTTPWLPAPDHFGVPKRHPDCSTPPHRSTPPVRSTRRPDGPVPFLGS